jgi:hypothetical protein
MRELEVKSTTQTLEALAPEINEEHHLYEAELSRRRKAAAKQKGRGRASEYAYRDKAREEWKERMKGDRSPLVYTTSLAGGGRGL